MTNRGKKSKDFKCDKCRFRTATEKGLKIHTKLAHKENGMVSLRDGVMRNFVCIKCNLGTDYKRVMLKHVEDEHGNAGKHDSNDHNVPVVDQTEEDLPVEAKSLSLGMNDFKCDKCDYETPLEEDLRRHYDSIHQGPIINYVCKFVYLPTHQYYCLPIPFPSKCRHSLCMVFLRRTT